MPADDSLREAHRLGYPYSQRPVVVGAEAELLKVYLSAEAGGFDYRHNVGEFNAFRF